MTDKLEKTCTDSRLSNQEEKELSYQFTHSATIIILL